MRPRTHRCRMLAAALALRLVTSVASAEVMLQWFETDWDEMYRRLPEAAVAGYDLLWIPPPTKAPTGKGTKWSNVGYSLYDRFDIGDVPQRGSLATRYGTRGSLRNMVDQAHQLDIKIIPDIVMNHNGNGPDFRTYPGMVPEDFHLQWQQGYYNTLNYKRAPRMYQWDPANGYGGTMWQDLANLIDIRTEDNADPGRFTGGNNTPGYNLVAGTSFLRHVGQPDKYPYYPAGYTNENAPTMLNRWITWLGNAIDYDGLRIDAAKHTPWEFFGQRGWGFLHEAQWNFNQRRGYSDANPDEADQLFQNDIVRNDALIFAEILSYQGELNYWYGNVYTKDNSRNPMRLLDYPIHQKVLDAVNGGNIGLLENNGALDPDISVNYCWGHDDDNAGKRPNKPVLAYAYLMTHIGLPMIYTTGKNLAWSDSGRSAYPNSRTWMVPGFDSHAFGDDGDDIVNLLWINRNFARGREYNRWADGDVLAYERYDDRNFNQNPDSGEGLLLVALNDSGGDTTRNNVTVSFPVGTVLHDYTGNNPTDITVYQNGSFNQVNVTVPGNGGQGYVCYAPSCADQLAISFRQGGAPVGTMTWIVPGGALGTPRTRHLPRLTDTNFTVSVGFNPAGGPVDAVMVRWGQGRQRLTAGNYWATDTVSLVSSGYELANAVNTTNWVLDVVNGSALREGLNVVRARAFNQRAASLPALYNTATEVVYVDVHGPDLDIESPAEGATVTGDAVMVIRNPDFTAYGMTVGINGVTNTAHEIMKGLWKFSLAGLPPGPQAITVSATEADWDSPRNVINGSVAVRNMTVAANPQPIALSHPDGATLALPFFKTVVSAPGAADVKLYWDGYELPFNDGGLTNTFNGEVVYRDALGNVSNSRLWGNFVNGQHFFEAVRVDGGVTSRAVSRVTFNLYGINAIDSDGDSLPDNVELPFFDDGAPGGDQPFPGDDAGNPDYIPKDENWTRLNPYNHSTFYIGAWDDALDSDNDGYSNGAEVRAGYTEDGNIYKYSIFNSASHPSGSSTTPAAVSWVPNPVALGQPMTISYTPNQGPLATATQIIAHVGHSAGTAGSWQGVLDLPMTFVGPHWTAAYPVPATATSVDFVFFDGAATWDNNGGTDWHAAVQGSTNRYFTMNGAFDGNDYVIVPGGAGLMEIRAAVKNGSLYVATHSAGGGGNDHYVYVTDTLGDAHNPAPAWNKPGSIFMNTDTKPWMAAEGANSFCTWNHAPGAVIANSGVALEGELNLQSVFGHVPEALYVAAVAFQTSDGGSVVSQGPPAWDADNNIMPMELQRVPVASIRDDDQDGYFDDGKPQMWTVVGGNTNDANYGLRRFFINELAGETATLTVLLRPNAGGTNAVTHVELFSNVNRREFAALEEDPADVTTASVDTYYRAYPMQDLGGGLYSCTLPVSKCGAYRVNARYRVNGRPYAYYTDHGLRRDCAVVVSPTKALSLSMYELNPMVAEATTDQKSGRSTFADMYLSNTNKPDRINTNHFVGLGVNMIWLQPIHPIGTVGREPDPGNGNQPYEPGSPYAVKNYWKVNPALGADDTAAGALAEFQGFVAALDAAGVGVMLDGTFNHSAWDCEIGEVGVDMGIGPDASQEIRLARPQWYSRKDRYGEHATVDWEVAPAPDRIDFGKWTDAADFFFGKYDALVQFPATDTNNAWSSPWYHQYLQEDDAFEGHDAYTRELWEYFARYPLYWLEKTGHPAGTPATQSGRGIDGLRCDFAQGLPSAFWEYCINRTRSVKWDFLFMAESLDGYRTVAGSNRHGVGFRSSRHFDILNENFVFYWRDSFFNYLGGVSRTPAPFTSPTRTQYDLRRQAFDASPILLNLTSHDEIYPSHDPYRILYCYAEAASLDGVPMLFYGQEAGAQNDTTVYNYGGELPNNLHNFTRYEVNFGKSIPNFKRFNSMTNVWNNRDWGLQALYGRVNHARAASPALRSQGVYFLERTDSSAPDPDVYAVAKVEQPGVSASTQDVVFAFVNNNYWGSESRMATFKLNPTLPDGRNWFGIEDGKQYNIVDLLSTNPAAYIWSPNKTGDELIDGGMFVWLNQPALQGGQAQYLKLVDVNTTYPDADGDGTPDYSDWDDDDDALPDAWEQQHGLNPNSPAGDEGALGDKDKDGLTNYEEFLAGTNPNDPADRLEIEAITPSSGSAQVQWTTEPGRSYQLEYTDKLVPQPQNWSPAFGYATALTNTQSYPYAIPGNASNRYFRVNVRP
ncbi:MAG: hypothetical protein K8T26_15350 [Lentisphaerae bacterium]|nr:hypothetical protein [Lentisphaerota bacterium]